jgi:siroheme synthase-like protein
MFPIFLKLEERRALVVGAGRVATEKAEALLRAGARVLVVAPKATERVRSLARSGRIEWRAREFLEEDVNGARVVVASTSDTGVNRSVYWAASGRGIPVNVVDVPELCDFYFGSLIERGPVTIAISTSGGSPALASRLREFLDAILPRRLAELALSLARTRPLLKGSLSRFEDRVKSLDGLLKELPLSELDRHAGPEIEERVDRWVRELGR